MRFGQVVLSAILAMASVRGSPIPTPDIVGNSNEDDWIGAAQLSRRRLEPIPELNPVRRSTEDSEAPRLVKREPLAPLAPLAALPMVGKIGSGILKSQAIGSAVSKVKHHCIIS